MAANFEISDFVDPITDVLARSRSLFRERLETMPIGKAIIVKGMEAQNAASRANVIGRKCEPKRKFSVYKLTDGSVQVARVS